MIKIKAISLYQQNKQRLIIKKQNKMEQLTEIEINGEKYVRKSAIKGVVCNGMKAVLIRSEASGVHYGYLEIKEYTPSGCAVKLVDSRRVWSWKGAATLSQMAIEGVTCPDECKFSMVVPEIEIIGVVEIIPLTSIALDNLNNVQVWKV